MQVFDYLQNFHAGVDATLSFDRTGFEVAVEKFVAGHWCAQQTRWFTGTDAFQRAQDFAKRAVA